MFKNFKLFKMFGVDVYLNATWFLVFLMFFTWSGMTFTLFLSELSTVLILFGAILLHEFGHVLAARKYGVSTDKIVLHILGGAAFINQKESEKLTPKQNMWVYFAGPLVNLIISAIALIIFVIYTIFLYNGDGSSIDGFQTAMCTLFIFNSVIFLFNLLPIFPMDGGGILRNLMLHFKIKNSVIISAYISMVLCVALFIGMLMIGSITGIIISVLFFLLAIVEIKKEKGRDGEYEEDEEYE